MEHTLNQLFYKSATAKGSNVLFSDELEQCTGEQALQSIYSLSNSLLNLGLEPGDRIAFLCDSSVRHVLSFFSCQHLALIPCALHVRSTAANLSAALNWLDASALIIDARYKELADQVLEQFGQSIPVVLQDKPDANPACTTDQDKNIPVIGSRVKDENAPAMIILSSGTTGEPKGIIHSQKTLYESAMAGPKVFGDIDENDSVIVAMAPSFAAWNHVCLPYLAYGARLVFNHGFEAERFVNTLKDEEITHAPLVPTAWRRALNTLSNTTKLEKLRLLFFSGEPGTKDFISLVREKLPHVGIRSAYLSSEGGDASACVADDVLLSRETLCIGKAIDGASVRIVDPEGGINDSLPAGEVGEILICSDSLALGYWKNPSLSQERFIDGWWRSADLGKLDDKGNLTIQGRTDNMIISGGLKVHAEEVEAALLQHPNVSMAAVVGMPDRKWGQRIEAFVVCDDDTQGELIGDWCRDNELLASFKLPKQIHVRDSLPTGATGKLYRRDLLSTANQ